MGIKVNFEVNFWSVATTLGAVIAAGVWLQADVKALQQRDVDIQVKIDDARKEISRVETDFRQRFTQADARAERDREAILMMQGDIRVVRQILESMRVVPPPR